MATLCGFSKISELKNEIDNLKKEIKSLKEDFNKKFDEHSKEFEDLKETISISTSGISLFKYAKKYLLDNFSKLNHTLEETPEKYNRRSETYSYNDLDITQNEVECGFYSFSTCSNTIDFSGLTNLTDLSISNKSAKRIYNTSFIYTATYKGYNLSEYDAKQLFELIKDMKKSA